MASAACGLRRSQSNHRATFNRRRRSRRRCQRARRLPARIGVLALEGGWLLLPTRPLRGGVGLCRVVLIGLAVFGSRRRVIELSAARSLLPCSLGCDANPVSGLPRPPARPARPVGLVAAPVPRPPNTGSIEASEDIGSAPIGAAPNRSDKPGSGACGADPNPGPPKPGSALGGGSGAGAAGCAVDGCAAGGSAGAPASAVYNAASACAALL